MLSQKTQYALRAVYELAVQYGTGPRKIAEIAEKQAIPPRFLEGILNQLKGKFVDSRRGADGGYFLIRPPESITVGEVLRFVQGPIEPVDCMAGPSGARCRLFGKCAFMPLWDRVKDAVDGIYNRTTLQDLVDQAPPVAGGKGRAAAAAPPRTIRGRPGNQA